MENMKDGGPAFPAQDWKAKGNHHPGMSLRDWFAGQALAGLMAGYQSGPMSIKASAQAAIDAADAMLRARESGQEADDNESWLWSQADACLHRLSDGSHTATIDGWAASGATRAEAIRALRAKVKRGVR